VTATNKYDSKIPSIDINNVTVFADTVDRLSPKSWLDDSLVDLTISIVQAYLENDLNTAKLKIHCFPTSVWSIILRDYDNPDEEVYKNYRDLSEMDFVFFPIVHSNHFSCVVIDNIKSLASNNDSSKLSIHHMDSMLGLHDHKHSVNVIKHFMLSKLGIDEQKKSKIRNIHVLGQLPTPQQKNNYDCGLFVSENIKHFLQGAITGKVYDNTEKFKFEFSQSDITVNRQMLHIVLQNLFTDIDNNSVAVLNNLSWPNLINNSETVSPNIEILSSNKTISNMNTISELSSTDTKWESSNEINIVQFFGGNSRTYVQFKLPLQCTNAPQRVPLYYRQGYDRFVIYAHYEVDAIILKGKVYFSMCVLFNTSSSSNFILAAIAFTTCTAPVRRFWVFDRAAKRFLEWNDRQISSYSCVPTIEFDEPELISLFRHNLINERKLYDINRGINFTSKNAAKAYDDIPDLDKFDGTFDESHAQWSGPRDPVMWQKYLYMTGI